MSAWNCVCRIIGCCVCVVSVLLYFFVLWSKRVHQPPWCWSVTGATNWLMSPCLGSPITITQHCLQLSPKTSPSMVCRYHQKHHPPLLATTTNPKNITPITITQHCLPLSPKTSPTIVSNHNQHQKHRIHHLMLNESYPQKRVNHDESRIAGDKTAYLQTKYFCSFLKN